MFGILGLNARNLKYIKKRNPRKNIRFANNKYLTKKFLSERGIPVPETYAIIRNRKKLFDYNFTKFPDTFIIKPNHGSKGKGIYVTHKITCRKHIISKKTFFHHIERFIQDKRHHYLYHNITSHKQYFSIQGTTIPDIELKKDLINIIDGQYTLGGKPDQILIEELLTPSQKFKQFCTYGLADMRIISFNLVPVAAMLRMPTEKSGGKANLAQGGIGFGIDISSGKIVSMKQGKKIYRETFPEPYQSFQNTLIPHRDDILLYSSNIQYFTNIGFLGIDRVITEEGPKLLEINARSGLEIQNIAQLPLEKVMKKIADLNLSTPEKGVEISKSLFSQKKSSISTSNKIIYLSQQATITYHTHTSSRKIDVIVTTNTDKKRNYMSPTLAHKLKNAEKVILKLPNNIIISEPHLRKSEKIHGEHISLGKETLKKYYIKPIHKAKVQTKIFADNIIIGGELDQLQILDQKIYNIAKQFSLNKTLKPTNYLDEFDKFITRKGKYNPQFQYAFPDHQHIITRETELKRLRDEHLEGKLLQSPLAQLLYNKIKELNIKLGLIKAYKVQDYEQITYYNQQLYGNIHEDLLTLSEEKIQTRKTPPMEIMGKKIHTDQAIEILRTYLKEKGFTGVRIIKDPTMSARISIVVGSKPKVKLLTRATFKELEFKALLAHEIDIHLTRFINGQKTGRHIFRTGTAGYLATEEGLAIHAADQVYQQYIPGFDSIGKYKNYLMVHQAQNSNFVQMCSYLETMPDKKTGLAKSFRYITKFKRGIQDTSQKQGSFYKNKLYLEGFLKVQNQETKKYLHGKYALGEDNLFA